MTAPISKSQIRAFRLAGIPLTSSYDLAATILESAGLMRDGIPAGHTWRSAAKIPDSQLLSAIARPEPLDESSDARPAIYQ